MHTHLPIVLMTLIEFHKDALRNLVGVAFTRLQYQYAIETKFQRASKITAVVA